MLRVFFQKILKWVAINFFIVYNLPNGTNVRYSNMIYSVKKNAKPIPLFRETKRRGDHS